MRTGHWRWVALLAALWGLAAEDKPFFAYLMPGIAVFSLAAIVRLGCAPRRRGDWLRLAIAVGVSAAVAIGLLAALRVSSGSYLLFLSNETPGQDQSTLAPGALSGLFLLTDWAFSGHRITYNLLNNVSGVSLLEGIANRLPDLRSPRWIAGSVFTALSIVAPVGLLILALRRRKRMNLGVLLSLIASVLLFTGAMLPGGWVMHHYLFAQVPLAAEGAMILTSEDGRAALLLLFGGSLAGLLAIIAIPQQPYAGYEVARAMNVALTQTDEDTIINCSDWRCYFPGSFTARDHIPVVFANTPDFAEQLERHVIRDGGRLLHVCAF